MRSISGKNLLRAFLRALSRALTGPLPSAAVCSISPWESRTLTLASDLPSPVPYSSMKTLNSSTVNLGWKSPLSFLTMSSKLASAPSNWYPRDSISLILSTMSLVSPSSTMPSCLSFSEMLDLPAMSDTRTLLTLPTDSGVTCS